MGNNKRQRQRSGSNDATNGSSGSLTNADDALPTVVELCEAYSSGPAALLDTSQDSFVWRCSNSQFLEEHARALLDECRRTLIAYPHEWNVAGARWTITSLRNGRWLYFTSASPAPDTFLVDKKAQEGDWLQVLADNIDVPGVSKEASLDHINLIRAKDWSKTSLGPLRSWPLSLQAAVAQCLGSPFPMLLTWGSDLTMIYNYVYASSVSNEHSRLLGEAYTIGYAEIWEGIGPSFQAALQGKTINAKDDLLFLQRDGILQECYYNWSLIPGYDEEGKVAGLFIPNFEVTEGIITSRRLQLLREAAYAFNVKSNAISFFQAICAVVTRQPADCPLVAIFDSSAADEEREGSDDSRSQSASFERSRSDDGNGVEQASSTPASIHFHLVATAGLRPGQGAIPTEIQAYRNDEMVERPSFLAFFRQCELSHQIVIVNTAEIAFPEQLDRTSRDDEVTSLAFIPILTMNNALRAIAVIGLNPRRPVDAAYKVFLELFQAQVSHGITSIRLIREEVRRARFFAALVKRKNDELHQLLEAKTEDLKSSELRFLRMAEDSPLGIWMANPQGEVTYTNESWWNISQHDRESGASTFLNSVHEEDRPRCTQIWVNAMTSKTPCAPAEFRWKRGPSDTSDRWAWALANPELDKAGNLVAITGSIMDITEKKAIELYERQRAEHAIEQYGAQERFVDMTSHELRNPLSAIILSADSAADRLSSPSATTSPTQQAEEVAQTLEDLKIISHCCTHMTRLIDDILTLSKIDNSFLVVTAIPSRPADFIRETLSVFKAEMLSKDIQYELEVKPSFATLDVDYLLTDPSRVNQLLINLLTNAIKFTAAGSDRHIRVILDVAARRPILPGSASSSQVDSHVNASPASTPSEDPDTVFLSVSVCDTGRGLTSDEAAGLFKRFKQASAMTHISYGGSGLGLFICKRLAELLGGDIGVESEWGKGSTFTFYVPTKRCAKPPKSAPTASKPTASTAVTTSTAGDMAPQTAQGLHVLIVEDNLVNQALLKKLLTKQGCICTVANHGQEAIDLIKNTQHVTPNGSRRFDCVLMDIEMPVLSGMATIQLLRQMQANREIQGHIPILACTANARDEQIRAMEAAGFDGIISKPFRIPEIMKRMRDLLADLSARGQAIRT